MFSLGKTEEEKCASTLVIYEYERKIARFLLIFAIGFTIITLFASRKVGLSIFLGAAFLLGDYPYAYFFACGLFVMHRDDIIDKSVRDYSTEEMLRDYMTGGSTLVNIQQTVDFLWVFLAFCVGIWKGMILGVVQLPTYLRCKKKIKAIMENQEKGQGKSRKTNGTSRLSGTKNNRGGSRQISGGRPRSGEGRESGSRTRSGEGRVSGSRPRSGEERVSGSRLRSGEGHGSGSRPRNTEERVPDSYAQNRGERTSVRPRQNGGSQMTVQNPYRLSRDDYDYRESHGVIPQLDFVNYENPLENLQIPEVEYSPYANPATVKNKGLAKSIGHIAGAVTIGGLSYGAGGGRTGRSMVLNSLGKAQEGLQESKEQREINTEVVKWIQKSEAAAWPYLYLARSFVPARGAIGDIVFRDGSCDTYHTGNGHRIFENGDYFEGYFEQGQIRVGLYIIANGIRYIGAFDRNLRFTGIGLVLYQDGTYYYGELSNGAFRGQGYRLYTDGAYSGAFVNGQREQGCLRLSDGTCFIGDFENDQPVYE